MKTAGAMSRICFVTHRPTSVAPETMVASGHLLEHRRQVVDIGGHNETPVLVVDLDAGAVRKTPEPGLHPLAHRRQPVRRGVRAHAAHDLGGPHDRRIAGAAAEIALQRLLDLVLRRPRRRQPEAVERHDEARRAEAALRAVLVDERLLHGMQRAGQSQVLHRHDVGRVERSDEADAGIDGLVAEIAVDEPPDEHRAGAAVALRAAFLRAGQALLEPQMVEQRRARG